MANVKRFLIFALLFAGVRGLAASEPLPYFDAKDLTPFWKEAARPTLTLGSFKVIDQSQRAVSDTSLKNRIALVNFFFADCPSICPMMMSRIRELQQQIDKNLVHYYSFTVQPEKDGPEKLRGFARARKLDLTNWSLLTGNKSEIFRVGQDMLKADGAVGDQKNRQSFLHTTNMYLVDKSLRLRGIYDTSDAKAMLLLAADVRRLSEE